MLWCLCMHIGVCACIYNICYKNPVDICVVVGMYFITHLRFHFWLHYLLFQNLLMGVSRKWIKKMFFIFTDIGSVWENVCNYIEKQMLQQKVSDSTIAYFAISLQFCLLSASWSLDRFCCSVKTENIFYKNKNTFKLIF